MKLVLISDTHNKHKQVTVPEGDILIHAGDISGRGHDIEIEMFLDWFIAQPHKHKILIAGNHDFGFEKEPERIEAMIPKNIIYLNDSGIVIEGINIWGSPIQPTFFDWAFNKDRGADIKKHWDLIPTNTDILITHGPPYGILDEVAKRPHQRVNPNEDPHVGCKDLLDAIERIKPKLNVFGHIHEAYGQFKMNGTTFVNASVLNEAYLHKNQPVVIDYASL